MDHVSWLVVSCGMLHYAALSCTEHYEIMMWCRIVMSNYHADAQRASVCAQVTVHAPFVFPRMRACPRISARARVSARVRVRRRTSPPGRDPQKLVSWRIFAEKNHGREIVRVCVYLSAFINHQMADTPFCTRQTRHVCARARTTRRVRAPRRPRTVTTATVTPLQPSL